MDRLTELFTNSSKFIKIQFERVKLYQTGSMESFVLKINAFKDSQEKGIVNYVDVDIKKKYLEEAKAESAKLGLDNNVKVSFETKEYLDQLKIQYLKLNKELFAGAENTVRALGNIFPDASRIISGATQDEINNIILKAVIDEDTGDELAIKLFKYIQEDQLESFKLVDLNGITKLQSINPITGKITNFDPGTIADTWARTGMRDITEHARHDYYKANNLDLVIVSTHGDCCPICERWQGEILSLSGNSKKYKSYKAAVIDGLFHFNCEHNTYSYYGNEDKANG